MFSKTTLRTVALLALVTLAALPALADDEADAKKLAGLAGAMNWAKDNVADGEEEGKYRLARLAVLKELDRYVDRGAIEKGEILVLAKTVEERGRFLLRDLDRDRCERFRKLVELDRWSDLLKDDGDDDDD